MTKFQRLYRITIDLKYLNETVTIESPLTAHIHIDRRPSSSI